MSGFVKKVKKRTGRIISNLRPGSRATSPTPTDPAPLPPISGRHTYAEPQTPQTAGATAGSVLYEPLAVARDGSDLCLPLKAALVGVVKIWDVCEVHMAQPNSAGTDNLHAAERTSQKRVREGRK